MNFLDDVSGADWKWYYSCGKETYSNLKDISAIVQCSCCGYKSILAKNEKEFEILTALSKTSPIKVPFEFVGRSRSAVEKEFELKKVKIDGLPIKCTYKRIWYKDGKSKKYRLSGEVEFTIASKAKGLLPALKGVCPCCGHKYDELSEEKLKLQCEKDYGKIIKKYKSKVKPANVEIDYGSFDVKEYIGTLVELYKETYTLEKQIKGFIQKKYECQGVVLKARGEYLLEKKDDYPTEYRKQRKKLEELKEQTEGEVRLTTSEKKKAWDDFLRTNSDWEIINVSIEKPQVPVMPEKPSAPKKPIPFSFDLSRLVKPQEPIYGSGSIFSKKRVEKQNEELKKIYEEALAKYNSALKEYDQLQFEHKKKEEEYCHACDVFEEEKKAYVVSMDEYNELLEKFNESLSEYEAFEKKKKEFLFQEADYKERVFGEALQGKKAELSKELRETQNYLDSYDKMHMEEIKHKADMLPKVISGTTAELIIDDELKTMVQDLFDLYGAIDELNSLNIIFEKYNKLPVLCVMYEYFLSGRVSELTGPYGAYNLYEKELKSDKILHKLDVIDEKLETILTKLDDIKDSQTILYDTMKEINKGVERINTSMDKLLKIIRNTTSINKSSDRITNLVSSCRSSVTSLPSYSSYSSIMRSQHNMIEGTVKKASVVGRGILGGIIAGPAGAIVGALSAVNKNRR